MMDVGIRIPDSQHASAPRSQPVMLQTALRPPKNQQEGSAIETRAQGIHSRDK